MNIPINEATSTSKLADAGLILKHVNLALKCLRLYPPNHTSSEEAVDKLLKSLSVYLADHERIAFNVTRNGLLIDEKPASEDSQALQSLATHLYRLKLDQILIQDNMDRQQLVELLMILCMDADDVIRTGGVKELLWQKRVTAVTVSQTRLKLNREVAIDYNDSEEIEKKVIRDRLGESLLTNADLSESEQSNLKQQLEESTKELARFIISLIGRSGDAGSETIVHTVLPKIDSVIKRELPSEQLFLYRNLAEAILSLDQPTRAKLASKLVTSSSSNSKPAIDSIMSQMTGDELAELLKLTLSAPDLPQNKLLDFIGTLPIKTEQHNRLLKFLTDRSLLTNQETEHINNLKNSDRSERKAKAKVAIPLDDGSAIKIAEAASEVSVNELSRIKKERLGLSQEQIEIDSVKCLGEILSSENDTSRFTRVTNSIQQILENSFNESRLETVIAALSVLISESKKRQKNAGILSILKEIIRDAGQKNKIEQLLTALESQSNTAFAQAEKYLELLGNTGITSLLDMLAVEKLQGRRSLICHLLAACGQVNISSLGDKVLDHRWYFVRNVVLILGQIGDEAAVSYMRKAAAHPDSRVRLEIVKALAKMGSRATPILTDLLNDKEISVRLESIKVISRAGSADSADYLVKIVTQRDLFRRRTDLKIEAIKALGTLKAKNARPILINVINKKAIFFRSSSRRLREASRRAISMIGGNK